MTATPVPGFPKYSQQLMHANSWRIIGQLNRTAGYVWQDASGKWRARRTDEQLPIEAADMESAMRRVCDNA